MICVSANVVKDFWQKNLDPCTASVVQDILGQANPGTANNPLSAVLKSARENIVDNIQQSLYFPVYLLFVCFILKDGTLNGSIKKTAIRCIFPSCYSSELQVLTSDAALMTAAESRSIVYDSDDAWSLLRWKAEGLEMWMRKLQ